ncbi:MAG: hypothetical protein H6563_07125 [Lewinellaceae bacterium]|nr:hypothetical protein [Lewinellaceae bacterium]
MDAVSTPIGPLSPIDATKVLAFCESFCQKDDERYLWFAAHIAFPVVLTTDLTYKIWLNFRKDNQENAEFLHIPLVAVSDVLLSDLFRATGQGLFETTPDIRSALLRYLVAHPLFGSKRLDHLASFLKFYLRESLQYIPSLAFFRAQEFTYLAHIEPQRAAEKLLEAWNQQAEQSRFRQMMEWSEQEAQLANGGNIRQGAVNPLGVAVQLVKGIRHFQMGNTEEALGLLKNLKGIASRMKDEGIPVNIPKSVLEALPREIFGDVPDIHIEEQTTSTTRYAKIHLLTPKGADQNAIAKRLFGVSIQSLKSEPLKCYQWEVEAGILNKHKWIFQIWQFTDEIPDVLDKFLFTENGFFAIWIPKGLNDVESYINRWQNRLFSQVGERNAWLLLPNGFDINLLKNIKNWIGSFRDIWALLFDWDLWEAIDYNKKIKGHFFSYDRGNIEAQSRYNSGPSFFLRSKDTDALALNEGGLARWFGEDSPLSSLVFTAPPQLGRKTPRSFLSSTKKGRLSFQGT